MGDKVVQVEQAKWEALVNVFWQADQVLSLRLRGEDIDWEEWMILKDYITNVSRLYEDKR